MPSAPCPWPSSSFPPWCPSGHGTTKVQQDHAEGIPVRDFLMPLTLLEAPCSSPGCGGQGASGAGAASSTATQQLPSIVSPLPGQPLQSAISHHLPPTGLCRLFLLFGVFHFRHPALGPPLPPSLCAALSSPSAQELWARLCRGVPPTKPLPFLQSELVGQLGSVPGMGLAMVDI